MIDSADTSIVAFSIKWKFDHWTIVLIFTTIRRCDKDYTILAFIILIERFSFVVYGCCALPFLMFKNTTCTTYDKYFIHKTHILIWFASIMI